ncbi:MAG: AAA family ATPase [Lachnospiraceae bacterium]|nr:AAA family ATPase [Lachnospiraceae bacterium]
MIDIVKIMDVIKKINSYCNEIDKLEESNLSQYQNEKSSIEKQTSDLISNMGKKYEAFKNKHFVSIENEIKSLLDLISKDYSDEVRACSVNVPEFGSFSYEENEKKLFELIHALNRYINQLNNVDFDILVPPINVEVNGETFITYTGSRANAKQYNVNSNAMGSIVDPKPIRQLVRTLLPYCKKINACVEALSSQYDKQFNIGGFNSYVKSSATAWLAELKAKLDTDYSTRFDQLFRDEKAKAVPKSFFEQLIDDGTKADVDPETGSSEYREAINIGDMNLLVEQQSKHLGYIKDSPVLHKYLKNGYLSAPLILNLKDRGNILLNIDEENYRDETVRFINQLIVQFLLAFPANRITFCLIDIDNKMDFSKFKSLTRINNSILFNGIIRDDRQLENTIKDMEQTMYKINDDILSYNSVEDIYQYNKQFEANPQNVHLYVLVNFPSGMRDDTAKRVLKVIQNGKKAGIFSIIVNNKACQLNPSYKPTEYAQFIENVRPHSLVINKTTGAFKLELGIANYFLPKEDIYTPKLNNIINTLKENAESNRQKVVPLTQMFEETDNNVKSPKGIPSSAEVLDIPIGARGREVQNLLLKTTGDGSAHAVLIGGTGSGKSNLLHTIIMSACYKYSPEELNLYLVDFKGGVEFKFYEANKIKEKQIPHIKLTGLTSDLEDGVAILNNLQKELRRREDEFRKCGVEDIVQYRGKGKKIPRLFVIIDEIQELFEQDDRLGQKAIDILREIFKKGRAFGINILWASQNIPKAPGLKDKVLSQIGNRISLRLNEPDDALDIKIDPKIVKNLNRPEKGLGVINDIRYGNDSIEFRVAYAETSENRQQFAQKIIEKWSGVTGDYAQEPLFIVGDDDEPSPVDGNTIYNIVPKQEDIASKSFDSYILQLGQDYVTGKPFDMPLSLRENKMNVFLAGYDVEILRDMMGYSLLSVVMEQVKNADCVKEHTKIYYANGEMINPKNSNDLFNVLRTDFSQIIENVSSTEQLLECLKAIYKIYKQRSLDSDTSEYAKVYTPYFVVIHSMQRYTDLFTENPMLQLFEAKVARTFSQTTQQSITQPNTSKLAEANAFFAAGNAIKTIVKPTMQKSKMPDSIYFSDAFKEMLSRGGKFGVHFIISIDNPMAITALKNDIPETMYKIFVKGINSNVVTQMLGDYKASSSLNNPKVALVASQDERTKIRVYRYDEATDEKWYKILCSNYHKLMGNLS